MGYESLTCLNLGVLDKLYFYILILALSYFYVLILALLYKAFKMRDHYVFIYLIKSFNHNFKIIKLRHIYVLNNNYSLNIGSNDSK